MIAENFDGSNLLYDPRVYTRAQWLQDNAYSYEMYFSDTIEKGEVERKINLYLDNYFSMSATLKDTLRSVWYIKADENHQLKNQESLFGQTIKEIMESKNRIAGAAPLIYIASREDEKRDFKSKMDVDLTQIEDFEYLKRKLFEYGYILYPGKMNIESLVLSKR